jgi:hypothetical protein
MGRSGSVAGDGGDRHCGLACDIAIPAAAQLGFWWFLLSNILWIIWGWHARAYALIVLQVCLVILNVRGAKKNDPEKTAAAEA